MDAAAQGPSESKEMHSTPQDGSFKGEVEIQPNHGINIGNLWFEDVWMMRSVTRLFFWLLSYSRRLCIHRTNLPQSKVSCCKSGVCS